MAAGNDYWGLSISGDNQRPGGSRRCGRRAPPHWGVVQNGQAQWKAGQPSICGLNEFWLRIDMGSHNPNPTLAIQNMVITVGFQHNMYAQPRLVPGENDLWLEAAGLAAGGGFQAEVDLPDQRAGEASLCQPEQKPAGRRSL